MVDGERINDLYLDGKWLIGESLVHTKRLKDGLKMRGKTSKYGITCRYLRGVDS